MEPVAATPPTVWPAIYRTLTGCLLGVMLFLSFGVAPALFAQFPSEEAGKVMRVLFPVYYKSIYVLAGLGVAVLVLARRELGRFWISLGMLVFVAVFAATNDLRIAPMLDRARGVDPETFSRLHGVSMTLNLLAIVALCLAICLPKRASDSS